LHRVLVDDPGPLLAAAEAKVTKVLSQVPDHAFAHFCLGRIQINTNRFAQGIAECERALALDRNLAGAHAMIGIAKYRLGHPDESEAHIKEALRLSPRDTIAHVWLAVAGFAKVMLSREQEAVAWLRRAIEANRNYALAYFWLAAALAHLGRLDDARAEVQTGLALDPQFTLRRYRAGPGSDNPTFLAQRERTCDGMRKAGVPEG
jgi:tetratricopeptide (TPR) repeat protein